MRIKNSVKKYFKGIVTNGIFNHDIANYFSNGQIFKQQEITKEHQLGVHP